MYEYNQDYIDRRYEVMTLNIVHRRRRTGFEETKEFPIRTNDLIAGRYQVGILAAIAQIGFQLWMNVVILLSTNSLGYSRPLQRSAGSANAWPMHGA